MGIKSGRQQMSDLDDLVAALIKGDPNETVPLNTVTAMAQAAINDGWQPPQKRGNDA